MTDVLRRGRLQLLLLAVLFFAPLLAAVLLYFVFPQWQPQTYTNYGELIVPARMLPAAPLLDADGADAGGTALHGKWSFIYLGAENCDAQCADKLYQIRQIRTLLNEKRMRVQRVYIAPDGAALERARAVLAPEHPDLRYYADTPAQDYRRFFGGHDPQALYLVDPLGNWLMVYPGNAESKGILRDIKRLLRFSQIG
ncbi:Cytochrome oxidase Cu insertion factor, SCO1/SenC/PrrC family [Fontimonas thermophila]|uniref:Cytochrome oxidase Cu insertion factor, SCO1/SenC/PrrC family n=1 Tax=Fontimonas thermophila TaxID=1076937 RepID=A0A1I2K350_9GAMM|nr:SCO family protein [Fontimonas thermophila]SFF59461.1 Cytochrome oxidase Cu insertion factor, SCO1/SenC/PrrC family [Fontimonas thermophila]